MKTKLTLAYIFLQCMLIAFLMYFFIKGNERSFDFACNGESIYIMNRNGSSTIITSNISLFFFTNKDIQAIIHGFVRDPDGTRTISREYNYKYKVVNEKEGRYVGSLYKVTITDNDNDDRNTVSGFMLGGKTSDIHFRISRLSNHVLIFENVFTPIFSCTITSP